MKRSSNRLVLLVGIFLAVVAFVLIAVMFQNQGSGSASPSGASTTANVVVAAKDLPLGSKLTADAVTTKAIAIGDKPADSYADPSEVIGQIVRQDVTSGQLITSAVLSGSTGTQDITVPAGFVGIAVHVAQDTGVAGLIKPGDFVDVVTGFSAIPETVYVGGTKAPGGPSASATIPYSNVESSQYDPNSVKTVVEGLKVLAALPATPSGAQDANASPQPATLPVEYYVVLAATTQQAEAIRFAQVSSTSTISLVLRSSADCQTADGQPSQCPIIPTTGVTLRQMVDQFGVLPPQVVEVVEPTPYPSPMPARQYPSPAPSHSPSASTKP